MVMQIQLELYTADDSINPFANLVCNAVPRVGESILLLSIETSLTGVYKVLDVNHVLEADKIGGLQQVCLVVERCSNAK
jgi:hypothetical protein